jgi:hypothetical protein
MIRSDHKACSMCHAALPESPAAARAITGGICGECLVRMGEPGGMGLIDFLDQLEMPVLVIDDDVKVQQANKQMRALLGKDPSQIAGRLGGEVFECVHAREPGGCGRAIHCSGCAIRRAVTETFMTGRSLDNVPAYLHRDMITEYVELDLLISTEKVFSAVLLRIDHIGPRRELS